MKFRSTNKWRMGYSGNRHEVATTEETHSVRVTLRLNEAEYLAIRDRDIDVTLEPVQTREERLREARVAGLKEFWRTTSMSGSYDEAKIIAVIERVDAEFAKENS